MNNIYIELDENKIVLSFVKVTIAATFKLRCLLHIVMYVVSWYIGKESSSFKTLRHATAFTPSLETDRREHIADLFDV